MTGPLVIPGHTGDGDYPLPETEGTKPITETRMEIERIVGLITAHVFTRLIENGRLIDKSPYQQTLMILDIRRACIGVLTSEVGGLIKKAKAGEE